MAYRIDYDPEKNSRYPMRLKSGKRLRTALTVLLLLLGFAAYQKRDVLKTWLLPGDAAVTEAALISMVDSLQSGESFKDAATAFCLEILEHATETSNYS